MTKIDMLEFISATLMLNRTTLMLILSILWDIPKVGIHTSPENTCSYSWCC